MYNNWLVAVSAGEVLGPGLQVVVDWYLHRDMVPSIPCEGRDMGRGAVF